MTAYYNEHDPHAAQWLRNLIVAGVIAPGDVDERDIRDVTPDELSGFTQCHFFAGIGVWSYALRLAGWPDDKPVWTGSCPCQPFSAAGSRAGFADERHLWPSWHWLIEQCRPPVIFGEQVSASIRQKWLDLVLNDLEGSGYACGALVAPACSVGAPHIRERLFFVADTESVGLRGRSNDGDDGRRERASGQGCETGELEHSASDGREQWRPEPSEWSAVGGCGSSKLGYSDKPGLEGRSLPERRRSDECAARPPSDLVRPGPTNGFWRNADWIGCTDGKWRPVESGAFPLADGTSFKLGSGSAFAGKSRAKMLRGYGNAIVATLAAEFIKAYLETVTL